MTKAELVLTILGCGSSGGVPRIGNDWGSCDPANPKNRRRRCSILARRNSGAGQTAVLVDTSPDIRQQLLDTDTGWVDGVLYTHEHADHIHGIDDLRVIAINGRSRVDVYANARTLDILKTRFDYCFTAPEGSAYPPILNPHLIAAGRPVTIDGKGGAITALPFDQQHGSIRSLGFRFGNCAYSSDLNDLPKSSLKHLENLDIWIVDALRATPHPTHFSLADTLDWIEAVKPKRAILTNMHTDLDYATLAEKLPRNVEPAYDGMELQIEI
jgi:phosphoribosyl 1,2-cyclic phosphate phosphodiesterase